MTTRNWSEVRALFHRALDRGPDERAALLREIAAADTGLAREVRSLLAAHTAASGFLDVPEASGPPRISNGPGLSKGPGIPNGPGLSSAGVPGILEISNALDAPDVSNPPDESSSARDTPVLKAGDRLGSFEIVGVAGRGGMGEVYRARDLRLDRFVAVKIVPHRWAGDDRARERFAREAHAISRLSHPHICTLYDVGQASPAPGAPALPFLVMEFLEGRTLAARVKEGALPPREALAHALAIADALVAAHAHGIVHRDLKPANVMLTQSGVKLLDFGVAQLASSPAAQVARSSDRVRTDTNGGTRGGDPVAPLAPLAAFATASSLWPRGHRPGTLRYMAPEQLRGDPTDHRADIFAFGVVLHEMLTGRSPFDAADDVGVIASVLAKPAPPIAARNARDTIDASDSGRLLAALSAIASRCLEKQATDRWPQMEDVRSALRSALTAADRPSRLPAVGRVLFPTKPGDVRRLARRGAIGTLFAVLAASIGASIVLAVVAATRESETPTPAGARLAIVPPDDVRFDLVQVSPDGRYIAFTGWKPDGSRIWIRALDSPDAASVAGTEGAHGPLFWSPDSRYLAFCLNDSLHALDMRAGTTRIIGEVGRALMGTWGSAGVILLDSPHAARDGLRSIPADGGHPVSVLQPDRSSGEAALLFPQFLPDGRRYLYVVHSWDPNRAGVYLGTLGSTSSKRVLPVPAPVLFVQSGHLLFVRRHTLMAQRFDLEREALEGDAVPIVRAQGPPDPRLRLYASYAGTTAWLSASQTGTVVYAVNAASLEQLAWYDRAGQRQQVVGQPGTYGGFALSPDGSRAVVSRAQGEGRPWNLWLLELVSGVSSRLTFGSSGHSDPRWGPDGRVLLASGMRNDDREMKEAVAILPDGRETVVYRDPGRSLSLDDVSADGRYVLYHVDRDRELWVTPVGTDLTSGDLGRDAKGAAKIDAKGTTKDDAAGESSVRSATLIWRSPSAAAPDQARFSPDGRWIAYHAQDSGRPEVYVTRFPSDGQRWQLSNAGGVQPIWRRDGRELYYLGLDGRLFAVPLGATSLPSGSPGAEAPRPLFQTTIGPNPYTEQYAVDAGGSRFLLLEPDPASPRPLIDVILNWPAFERPATEP